MTEPIMNGNDTDNNDNNNNNDNSNDSNNESKTNDNNDDVKSALENKLNQRPTADDVGINSNIAPSLQSTAKVIEQKQKQQILKGKLEARMDLDSVLDRDIIPVDPTKIDSNLQANAASLKKGLNERANIDYLEHTNILPHNNMDPVLQPKAQEIENKLKNRPNNPNPNNIAPALQSNAKAVETDLKKKMVKDKLAKQPNEDVLHNQGILKNKNVDASLQATAVDLEQQIKKDKVKKGIENREDIDALYRDGVLQNKNVANSLQPTAKELQKNLTQSKVNKKMQNRPEEKELYRDGVLVNPGVASSLQGTAVALEQNIKV